MPLLQKLADNLLRRTYSAKVSIAAMIGSNIWAALLSVLFVPVYLHFVGPEGYGLIGIFSSLQAMMAVLDLGISATINRELARLSGDSNASAEIADLRRTLERPNWIMAATITLVLGLAAPLIGLYWVEPKNLATETVIASLMVMAAIIGVQFSVNFYTGALLGLHRHALIAVTSIISATLRSVGAAIILYFISPTILAFLSWQFAIAILQLVVIRVATGLTAGPGKSGQFRMDLLKKVWRFAAGVTGLSVVGLIISQTDKVILSKLLDLETFGYYALALSVSAMFIGTVAGAINQAVYPRFSRLVALGDEKGLADLYHKSSQFVAILLIPSSVILVLYSFDILQLWTRNEKVAENTYVILSLCVAGNALQGMLYLTHSLQLAHGWTKLSFWLNVIAIIVIIPFMIIGVSFYGAVGGAVGWLSMTVFFFIFDVHFTHRRILRTEKWKWLRTSFAFPLLAALTVGGAGRYFLPSDATPIQTFLGLALISFLIFAATSLLTPHIRAQILQSFRDLFLKQTENPV